LEFKDPYTHGHAERVATVCTRIGEAMGLPQKDLKILYNAALLHDIGKIGVMESILNKRGALSEREWRTIRKHPEFGDEILSPISSLQAERGIVRHHHEREDGAGYPDGLYGSELSLSEKIIIAADSFDAMNSKRAYRPALRPSVIRRELTQNRGTQFDPDVADALLGMFEDLCGSEDEDTSEKVIPFQSPGANRKSS
jgi:HD-GYP domain-containing protein (c-di-GMP phosphodiesterase class II)